MRDAARQRATARAWVLRRTTAGLCRDCGKPRGPDGTSERCRPHANAWNQYLRKWARLHPKSRFVKRRKRSKP